MPIQLEITTRCNFDCFYCAGRLMPQEDMDWDVFTNIIDTEAPNRQGQRATIQGEGEPSLHPRFADMARYITSKGMIPNTVLNGTRLDGPLLAEVFPRISISIDSMDPNHSGKIGRHNLPKVLRNIEEMLPHFPASKVVIMTTDHGQPIQPVRDWAMRMGFLNHIIQELVQKVDYGRRYHVMSQFPKAYPGACAFVDTDTFRFYRYDGVQIPCCFMRDTSDFESIPVLQKRLSAGDTPKGCLGCRHLAPK